MQRAVTPAASVREAIESLVSVSFDSCEDEPDWVRLYFEFCLQATRDGFARDIVATSLNECRGIVASMLKAGQSGEIRSDLDTRAAAVLLIGLFDGLSLHWAIEKDAIAFKTLARTTADLIERFVTHSIPVAQTNSRPRRKSGARRSQ